VPHNSVQVNLTLLIMAGLSWLLSNRKLLHVDML